LSVKSLSFSLLFFESGRSWVQTPRAMLPVHFALVVLEMRSHEQFAQLALDFVYPHLNLPCN
jgi:hypothetical protein